MIDMGDENAGFCVGVQVGAANSPDTDARLTVVSAKFLLSERQSVQRSKVLGTIPCAEKFEVRPPAS